MYILLRSATEILIVINSGTVYCKSFLAGAPMSATEPLQLIQNEVLTHLNTAASLSASV